MSEDNQVEFAPYGMGSDGKAYLPNPTQQRVLDWVDRVRAGKHPRSGIPVLCLRGGVGCIEEDQQVLMANGEWVPIKDVKEGDLVVSYSTNRFMYIIAPVEKKIYSGEKECFEYVDSLGKEIVCTPCHRFLVKPKQLRCVSRKDRGIPQEGCVLGDEDMWYNINYLADEDDEHYAVSIPTGDIDVLVSDNKRKRYTHLSSTHTEIISKRFVGVKKVYDLTIRGSNNFVVNGFVVHNSGKTRGIMAAVCEMMFETPGLRVLWGRQDLKDLKLSVMDKFFGEVLPEGVVVKKSEQYNWYDIRTRGRGQPARIFFNGLKDLGGFGSQEFGVVVMTEAHETSEMAYRTLKRRLRQENVPVMMLIETEPPNESHWLMRLTDSTSDEYDADIETWELSTYENWDNLPESYKQSLESMPKAWQRKYLYGKAGFIPDGRPFYEGFREEIHAGDYTYNKLKPLITGWDFGFHHPSFVVSQTDDMGRWYILGELLGREITIDKFCDQVKAFCNVRFPDAKEWIHYGDPACMQHNDKSEATSWQICKAKGFNITVNQSTYRMRKEIIDGKLSKIINGKPTMLVDRSCKILIDGLLGGYHYPERKPGQQNSPAFEVPYRDGFYEHICLSGDTLVRALDGWHKISDLVGKEFITYAYDSKSKRIVPAQARNCRKTKENTELWKLVHDQGEIIATPDHPIMMRDGTFKELQHLKEYDELMPFYEKKRSKKGHTLINLNDGSTVDEHRYIYNWFKGHLREAHHIHHIDRNPFNNYPDNLQQILAKDHMAEVYRNMRYSENQKAMRKGCLNPWTEESRKKISFWAKKRALENRTEKKCAICGNIFMGMPNQKYCNKKCSWKASGLRRREGTASPYRCTKKCIVCGVEYQGMAFSKYCSIACRGTYQRKKNKLALVNHKVLSVGFHGYGDVYNLEVDEHHNFPANGIFVHNCNSMEYIAINMFRPVERHTSRNKHKYRKKAAPNAGFKF